MSAPTFSLLVFGVDLEEGLADTKRVRTLVDPLIAAEGAKVANLVKASPGDRLGRTVTADGIEVDRIPARASDPLAIPRLVLAGWRRLKQCRVAGARNVYFSYGHPDILTVWLALVARFLGYVVVFDIVEDQRHSNFQASLAFRIRLATSNLLIRRIAWLAHGTIAISEHLAAMVRECGGEGHPVAMIPIAVDTERFCPVDRPATDEVLVFWGGSITFAEGMRSNKDGLLELLAAFDACGDARLRLCISGKGDAASLEHLRSRIAACAHRDRIDFVGFLSAKEHLDLLGRADIAIMNRVNSSFANAGFPFKLGEYLAAGKAVIATDVGEIRSHLQDGRDALVIPPEDHSALVQAMRKLFSDAALRAELGRNARNLAVARFSSQSISARFRDFILSLK